MTFPRDTDKIIGQIPTYARMRTVTPPAPEQRAAVWCKADGSQGANITSEQRAEPFSVGPSGSPRYRADLEWPSKFRRQEEWYRRGRYAFVSYIVGDRGVFCWGKPSQSRLRRASSPTGGAKNAPLRSPAPCLPLWGRCPVRTLGGEGLTLCIITLTI